MFDWKRIIKIKLHIHKIYKIVSNARLCFDAETAAFCPVYMKRSLQRKIPFTLDQLFIKGGVARYAHKNITPCILWCTCRCITHHSIYRAETYDIWYNLPPNIWSSFPCCISKFKTALTFLLPRYEPERLRVCYNAPKSAYRGRID